MLLSIGIANFIFLLLLKNVGAEMIDSKTNERKQVDSSEEHAGERKDARGAGKALLKYLREERVCVCVCVLKP